MRGYNNNVWVQRIIFPTNLKQKEEMVSRCDQYMKYVTRVGW